MDKFIMFEADDVVVNLSEVSHAYVEEYYDCETGMVDEDTWVLEITMKNGKSIELLYDTKNEANKDLKRLFNKLS